MKTSSSKPGKPGFVSYVLVLSTGMILTTLMVITYRRVMDAHEIQSKIQLRTDYSEKEDAILRSIVAIAPNRAIRAMKGGSNANSTNRDPLRWQNIFSDALDLANARTSISSELKTSLNITNLRTGNSGDSSSTLDLTRIFDAIPPTSATSGVFVATGNVPTGSNSVLGAGFPAPLSTSTTVNNLDKKYPIISTSKVYGSLAQSNLDDKNLNGDGTVYYGLPTATYPGFNRLKYPNINFGYAKPGEPFVAKRNWWAFTMDVSGQDAEVALPDGDTTMVSRMVHPGRDFVLSIYEIPSQLAISASSFMSLGKFDSGDAWTEDMVKIDGGVFAGRVLLEGEAPTGSAKTSFDALSSRRRMDLEDDSTIGNQLIGSKPFENGGAREKFLLTQGEFFPVSLASESGRVAFVPINRGADFFDRFNPETLTARATESDALSPTTWDNYSIGALQCAMQLDITKVVGASDILPTELRFSYVLPGTAGRKTDVEPLVKGIVANLPGGYKKVAIEDFPYDFGEAVVDVAYGDEGQGKFYFQTDVTGVVTFNNQRFGDPIVGTKKAGYFRPSSPYRVKPLSNGKICIAVYPERFAAFLNLIGADTTAANHSLVVNVDYTNVGDIYPRKPNVNPCGENEDYGVILQECANLTSFTRGFSLVTNLRTYIGDDFNVVEVPKPWPTGYTPAVTDSNPDGKYYPPCSLFAPEKRYGVEVDPFRVKLGGQIGSLAKADKVSSSDADPAMVRPLESKTVSGASLGSEDIEVNLRPIRHPAELPPVTMMNWLVVIEELRKEYVNY